MTATATARTYSHPAYPALAAIVADTVKHYQTDFTDHDARHLAAIGPEVPFVWFARDMGTHIYSKTSHETDRANGWNGSDKCILMLAREHPGAPFYHWNGRTLAKIDPQRAAAMVADWWKQAPPETEEGARRRYARGGW